MNKQKEQIAYQDPMQLGCAMPVLVHQAAVGQGLPLQLNVI